MLKSIDPAKVLHILFIEKHPEDARFFQSLLSAHGAFFKVRVTSTVDETLRAVAVEPFHVIVASAGSCGESVSEAVSKVTTAAPDTAVVLLLSPGEESKVSEWRSWGVQNCVTKAAMDEAFLILLLQQAYEVKINQREFYQAQNRMNCIMTTITDGVVIVNARSEIAGINSAAAALLNQKEETVLRKPLKELLLGGNPEDRNVASGISFMAQSLQDGVKRTAARVAFLNRQGQPLWVSCIFTPVFSPARKVEGAVLIFRNILESHRTEDKLKDAIQEQLRNEQRLVEALSELRKLNQQLHDTQNQLLQAEKLQSVGRLAAGVAHEVKNPLAILLQGVEYLQQALPKEEKESHQVLEDMVDAVQRADMVIKGLLDFAAPAEPEMREENLQEVIDESLQLLKHLLVTHKIEIQKDFSSFSGKVIMDRNRMQQVFVNIFSNAVHAMKEGGRIQLLARRAQDDDKRVIVEVCDTGIGIPAELLDKVFDPFVTTRRGRGGTGLGLSVVRGIMEMHQGEIRIENLPQGGVKVALKF